MLASLGFTCLMGFAVSWLRTTGAFAGLSIIVGVIFGFFSETYVTPDALPVSVARFLQWLPFAQASALVREPYTSRIIAGLPEEVRSATLDSMGITLNAGSVHVEHILTKLGATTRTQAVLIAHQEGLLPHEVS